VRWHLKKKFAIIEELFRQYLPSGCKFVDVGCGEGDALVVASKLQPNAELWGLDINPECLEVARRRIPGAMLRCGDMQNPAALPREYFDVVHEFGAAFLASRWDVLVKSYLSLLRDEGILLWELPRRWSLAHISYLVSVAPRNTAADTRVKRIFRSFFPSKYRFESDASVLQALNSSGFEYEFVERVVIWHFFCPRVVRWGIDKLWGVAGDDLFERLDELTRRFWPREAGYYLVLRKKPPKGMLHSRATQIEP
jgi:SAM-dependent methyltransferase